jgi:hypothetical protein
LNAQLRPTNERWSGSSPANTVLSKTIRKELLGSTEQGSAWAYRAFHPNNSMTSRVEGIPDLTAEQSANIEIRHNQVMAAPAGLPANTNWDVMFAVLPLVDCPIAYRTRASTVTEWGPWIQFARDQGQILTGGLKPYIYTLGAETQPLEVTAVPTLMDNSKGFRQTFKGLTIVMNSNSLTNQGIVTAGQWLTTARDTAVVPSIGVNEGAAPGRLAKPINRLTYIDIPSEPDDIVIQCGEAGQWEAHKGVYMPMRFSEPVHLYNKDGGSPLEYSESGNPDVSEPSGSPVVLVDKGQDLAALNFQDWIVWRGAPVFSGTAPTTGTVMTTAGEINQNLGIVCFSGLDPKAMLMVKTRTGCELQPEESSLLISAAQDPPKVDEVALKMVQSAQRELPLVYEHKYNSAGLIIPLLAKALAAVAPTVLPWLGKRIMASFSPGRASGSDF